jgi:cell division protein FtsQ
VAEPILPILPNLQEPEPTVRPSRTRALSGALLLVMMVGAVWAFGYWEPRLLPVQVIEVQGELHHNSSEQLRETLVQRLSGGFLTADLNDLKQAAEALPWVGGASIRRVWPDRLQVRVDEHRPVARWKGDGLVTAEGVIFHPRIGTVPAGLPLLEGDEQRARELAQRYLQWRDQLMLAGQLIDTLGVDARGAWRVGLVSKARLELGTNDIEKRLARFINAAPQLDAAGRADLIDLRYSNGFAVKWAGSASAAAPIQVTAPETAHKPKEPSTKVSARPKTTDKARAPERPKTPAKGPARSPAPVRPASPVRQSPPARASLPPRAAAPGPALTQAQTGPARPETKPQERTGKRG